MKHINITNWQGNITDWTKFNYIYGGLDETIADKVNLSIPGTNLRNYFRKSNNLINVADATRTYESANLFFIRVWTSPYIELLGYKTNKWSTTTYNTFSFELTEAKTIRIQWGYNDVGFAIEDIDLPAGKYYFGCNYSNTSNTVTYSNNGIYKTVPTTYEPYGSMVLVENVATYTFTGNETFTKLNKSYGTAVLDSSIKQLASNADIINASLPGYTPDNANNVYNGVNDNTISGIVAGTPTKFRVYSSAINSPTEAQSALAGKTLTYELNTPKVTIFNQVDLGTLEWHYRAQGDPSYYDAYLSGVVNSINVSCPLYKSAWVFSTNTEDKRICTVQNSVRVRDNALQGSIIDLKAKLNGVIFIYELASQPSANMLGMVKPSDSAPTAIEDSMSLDELLEPANEER